MDDFVGGSSCENSAFFKCKGLKLCFKKAGFNMRKWKTNSIELSNRIDKSEHPNQQNPEKQPAKSEIEEDDQTYSGSLFEKASSQSSAEVKVLGLRWDTERDLFIFKFEPCYSPVSKRDILKATARFYDPLGLLGPITVLFKILLQSVCKSQVSWDDPLNPDIAKQWQVLANDLSETKAIAVNRYYVRDMSLAEASSIQIHGFADASEMAYGAVVYLRVKTESGNVETSLIMAKTRVAPIKGETIPRLELMGALVLARLIDSVRCAFENILRVDATYCWLDSMIALWWIRGLSKEFKRPLQRLYPLEVTADAETATVPAEHGERAAITVVSDADIPDVQVHGIQN